MKSRLLALFCAALLLAGCTPEVTKEESQTAQMITFSDDLGRTICLAPPERVAALTGSFADLWCLAGGNDTLVAAAGDSWTSFSLDLEDTVTDLGAIKAPNLELLLSCSPDLVLASSNTAAQVALLDVLETAGLTVAYFNVTNFEEYRNMLDICTQLTGNAEAYQQHGEALSEQIAATRSRADGSRPTVLYIRATGSICKVKNSRDTVLGEMLADLNCINVADSDTSLLEQLSLEAILEADPNYIFAVLQGADASAAQQTLEQTLLSNPAWQQLTAVQEGRFHVLDHRLYNLKPNAKWGDAYEQLADILYPET